MLNRIAARFRIPQARIGAHIGAILAAAAITLALLLAGPAQGAAQQSPTGAAAASPASTPLDRYLEHLKTLRVRFLQTVADAHGTEVGRSSGTLIVQRPGKFRWEIHPLSAASAGDSPQGSGAQQGSSGNGGQVMVSDGHNLWYYDRDLEQVTVRPVTAALSATPAMLLSGTVDVRKHFKETGAGTREGLDWVYVEPLSTEADFKSALFGFDRKGTLQRMILEDKLGQIVTIVFQNVELNVPVPAKEMTFTPPAGADVIGTPAQ